MVKLLSASHVNMLVFTFKSLQGKCYLIVKVYIISQIVITVFNYTAVYYSFL